MNEKERPSCPKCGALLSVYPRIREANEITIVVTCESCDYEGFRIRTGLTEKDLKKFAKPLREPITKEMRITR